MLLTKMTVFSIIQYYVRNKLCLVKLNTDSFAFPTLCAVIILTRTKKYWGGLLNYRNSNSIRFRFVCD